METNTTNPRGAGRKPLKIKKVPLFVYLPSNLVELAGGKNAVKDMLEQHFANIGKILLK